MDPKIWGRNLWTSLIHIAQGYPDNADRKTQHHYRVYFNSLGYVLPCASCKVNYQQHISALPPQLNSRQSLLNWLHQIHNRTLIQMKKPEISYDAFINKYTNQSSTSYHVIILLLVLVAVGYYCFFYKKGKNPFSLGK